MTNEMKETDVTVIGRLKEREGGNICLSYPSAAGIREVRIPSESITRIERITNDRVAVLVSDSDNFENRIHFAGGAAPYHVTEEQIRIVCAMENGEPLSDEDVDDETPHIDMSANTEQPLIVLAGEDGEAPVVGDTDVWGQGLFSGNRRHNACDWRFNPIKRPAFVFTEELEGANIAPTAAAVNNKDGSPAAFHIFNPDFSDSRRPMGAYLGTFTGRYHMDPYTKAFDPILQKSVENGWKADVTAYNEGKRARLDCDVSQAGHTKEMTADRMRGIGGMFEDSVTAPMVDSLKDLYRYGFTIHNSLDGSSSFRIQATAMRAKCSNMSILDAHTKTILTMRHTTGVMAGYDWEDLADKVSDTIVAAQQELVNLELLKNVAVSQDLLERIMTLSERNGIITKPKVHRNDAGDITKLTSGHLWRLMGHGWTRPHESWVGVTDEEEKGTLFHVYNILTGALTHKPVYNDVENNQVIQGNTITFQTLDKKLLSTHRMLTNIGEKAITSYFQEHGTIDVKSMSELKEYTRSVDILEDVPLFSEVLV